MHWMGPSGLLSVVLGGERSSWEGKGAEGEWRRAVVGPSWGMLLPNPSQEPSGVKGSLTLS